MDLRIRELERHCQEDPECKAELVNQYFKSQTGSCLFWVGANRPVPGAVLCEITHVIQGWRHFEGLKDNSIYRRDYWLLPILSVEDVVEGTKKLANGIIDITKQEQTWFHPWMKDLNTRGFQDPYINVGGYSYLNEGLFEVKTFQPRTYGSGPLRFWEDVSGESYRDGPHSCWTSGVMGSDGVVSLPYPSYYLITGVSVIPMPDTDLVEFNRLIGFTRFRLMVGTRDIVNVPSMQVATLAGRGDLRSTINAAPQPILSFPQVVDIIPLQCFAAMFLPMQSFTLEKPVRILLYFHGMYDRGL